MVQDGERRRPSDRTVAWCVMHDRCSHEINDEIGSCLHALRVLEHPRWEDFEYEQLDEIKNRFHWLGDGQTYSDKTKAGDRK
jgi:hypothetical protein